MVFDNERPDDESRYLVTEISRSSYKDIWKYSEVCL